MMSLRGKALILIQNDETINRLLIAGLFVASPSLHYLCFFHSYDPVWLRVVNSIFCLLTLGLSFYTTKKIYRVSLYATILSFIIINNCVLLGKNGFDHVYLFSSLMVFMSLTLFCKKQWEFIALTVTNVAAIIVAYTIAPYLSLSANLLAVLIVVFSLIAYISFLVLITFQYRLKRAIDRVMILNDDLVINDAKLTESREHLNSIINSLNDIIFEFDEDKICINVWFNEHTNGSAVDPRICIGKRLEDVVGPVKAEKYNVALDKVIKTRSSTTVEFSSDFGSGHWFIATMTPVFDNSGNYKERISVALTDITEQKQYAQALKENEELLLEAQAISKTGNWWYDQQTKEAYWSDNLYTLLEIDAIPEGKTLFEYYASLIHPDDRENTINYLMSIRTNDEDKFEHKFITPKGNGKYIKIIRAEKSMDPSSESKRIFGVIQDITESRLSEKAVKISQTELMEAQAIAKIGNWKLDVASNWLVWSDEVNTIYELGLADRNERSFIKLMIKYVHHNDRHILKSLLNNPAAPVDTSYEYRIVTPTGITKYISIIIGKHLRRDDGSIRKIIGTLQDVTDRKQAELDYLQTQRQYQLVLETINLIALSLDKDGNVVFCNKYLAKLLGYKQSEILGMNWMQHFVTDDIKPILIDWYKQDDIQPHFINPIICRNGEQRVISWQNTVIYDENGAIKETTSIGEDITDQQKAKQELIWAKEMAEKSSKFKSEFLSIMSHEIRTPMNAVIGTTNLLLTEDPRPEQMEYLNTLKFSGENLLAIINDILDYNKIEAGKLELNNSRFNIIQLTQNIKKSFDQKANQKQLELNLIVDESIPDYLTGDAMRLSQVLNNLISNAVKFTHTGHVNIRLDNEEIDDKQVTVKFTVTDTGIGISPQSFNVVFDPFMQEQQVINNDYGGTGLGLAITKRLVELHRSTISVSSELGKGTTFTFAISFAIAPKTMEIQPLQLAENKYDLQAMNILIVDDNKMNLMIASKFLKKWHANVDEALNGEIAVEMVKNRNYDLIIMDLQMPVMDGFEATAIIKQSHPLLPIIALTADAMPETHTKAFDAGMVDYLTKPFVPETFFGKVARHIRQGAVDALPE